MGTLLMVKNLLQDAVPFKARGLVDFADAVEIEGGIRTIACGTKMTFSSHSFTDHFLA